MKLEWPNVVVPGGWEDVMRKFNLSGYGLTLVDAEGIVRGVSIHERELKKLLAEMYPKDGEGKKAPTSGPGTEP